MRPRSRASRRGAAGTRRAPCGWPRRSSGWPRSSPTWSSRCCGWITRSPSSSWKATRSSRCSGSWPASRCTRRRPSATCPTATRRCTSPCRPRPPACSAPRTCRCGWCRWCPRSPASRCWPGWSSGRRRAPPPGSPRRACSPRPTSSRAPGSTSRRVDSLFLALSVGRPVRRAVDARHPRGAVAAGLLLAAASLTKQTGLAEGVAVLTALALGPRRRLGRDRRADLRRGPRDQHARARAGQPRLVRLLRLHADERALAQPRRLRPVLDRRLLPVLGLAVLRPDAGARRVPLVLLAGCVRAGRSRATPRWCTAAARSTTCCPRTSPWRCWPAWRWATARRPGQRGRGPAGPGRIAGWRPGQVRRWVAAAAAALVLAQLAVLVTGFHPGRAIPTSADRAVGWRLVAGMRALGGDVAVPADPGLEPAGRAAAGRAPGRGGRRAARLGPARHGELPAQRRPRGGGPAVQRDHHRERRAARRLPPRPDAVLPAAARRRCWPACRPPCSRRWLVPPGRPATSGCRLAAPRARRRSGRSTARRPPRTAGAGGPAGQEARHER